MGAQYNNIMTQTATQATAPQNNEQSNNPNKWEEMAKQREIGDYTRKMLIAHGKITDAVCIIGEIFSNEYGKDADKILHPFYDAINDSQRAALELMCMIIDDNMNNANRAII